VSGVYERGDAFANSDVRTEEKICGHDAELPVVNADLRAAHSLITNLEVRHLYADKLTQTVIRLLGAAINGPPMLGVCPFEGDVDVTYDQYGTATWDCPTCDWTHEDD
jgi:hypothetical protein